MSAEAMEVFLKDTLCGEQHAVHIGEGDTTAHLKAKALDVVLGSPADALPEDVELALDGEVLDDSTPLCGAAGVSQGCCIDVALSGARFVEVLEKQKPRFLKTGRDTPDIDINTIPTWARGLRDVALALVQLDGNALQYLEESFRNDRDIVIAALVSNSAALEHASEDLRADEDLLLFARCNLEFASPALLSNKPFALSVVRRVGESLKHFDAALQADREVVMAAVQENGWALQYACDSFRNDKQVVMASGGLIKDASAALRNDKEVVLHCIQMGFDVTACRALCDDREAMLAAVRRCGAPFFNEASPALRHDTGFQREAVLWHGGVLEHADPILRQDRDLVMAAVEG